jgi:hypothetical protein
MRVLPDELPDGIHSFSNNGLPAVFVIFAGHFVGRHRCLAVMAVGHGRYPSEACIALGRWTAELGWSSFAFTKLRQWFDHCHSEWSPTPILMRVILGNFSDSNGDRIHGICLLRQGFDVHGCHDFCQMLEKTTVNRDHKKWRKGRIRNVSKDSGYLCWFRVRVVSSLSLHALSPSVHQLLRHSIC